MTPKSTLYSNSPDFIKGQRLVPHSEPGCPLPRDLRALMQAAKSILPSGSLSLRMIKSQGNALPDGRARVVVPTPAKMLWEELRERRLRE